MKEKNAKMVTAATNFSQFVKAPLYDVLMESVRKHAIG